MKTITIHLNAIQTEASKDLTGYTPLCHNDFVNSKPKTFNYVPPYVGNARRNFAKTRKNNNA